MAQVTEKDLQHQLNDLRERYPKPKDDELFVAWFMQCFVTDTEAQGVSSLVGGSHDKGLDALYIDSGAKKVFLVQGKYHQKIDGGTEKRADVMAFAQLARTLSDPDEYKAFRKGLAPAAAGKTDEARKRIEQQGYRLHLYYVTTGKVSESLRSEAQKSVKLLGNGACFEAFDGKTVLRLLSDFLDGVAPPVPELEFELESGSGIANTSVLQRYDQNARIESWVVPVAVAQIADLYESVGVRLFARNVRGYLGNTEINKNLKHTLEHEPEYFWYYNNGITIVCDGAQKTSQSGKDILRLVNPQIINGQQTTRTLHEYASTGINAAVMVRVISVPRDSEEDTQRFENLISRIVAATNWQNKISASDLMSNDRRQIELERNLRKLEYQYLRKRQSKSEAKRLAGGVHHFQITKEDLAQVSAACELDPQVLRQGKEHLFGENLYSTVFPHADAEYYLGRHWLGVQVKYGARGFPERAYMKWLAIHFLWKRLGPILNKKSRRQMFRVLAEQKDFQHLPKAIDLVFKGIAAYYRENCGTGETRIDVSTFFLRKGHHKELEKYWQASDLGHMKAFDKAWTAFSAELEESEEG
jgi:hypothetical protein